MEKEFAPFYVGQEVEAVVTTRLMNKGDRFIVLDIMKFCTCSPYVISVGFDNKQMSAECDNCNVRIATDKDWSAADMFRAITPAIQAVTFEKITEQHHVSVN